MTHTGTGNNTVHNCPHTTGLLGMAGLGYSGPLSAIPPKQAKPVLCTQGIQSALPFSLPMAISLCSDAVAHPRRHMREAHSHIVLLPLVIEHRLQPRLSRIPWQALTAVLHRIEDILYEVLFYPR